MGHNAKMSFGVSVSCALAALALFAATPAWATAEHTYDPALSLTGSTAVSTEDEIPDPGSAHPAKSFEIPCATVTDRHGYIYVATSANGSAEGRIDIFNAQGEYLTEIHDEYEPCGLAVDSEGNLYVREYKERFSTPARYFVQLFSPPSFPPGAGAEYTLVKSFEFVFANGSDGCKQPESVAVDPSNNHLYIGHFCRIEEYGSAAEGSPLIDEEAIGGESGYEFMGVDVYGANHDVYVAAGAFPENPNGDQVLVFDGTDGHAKCEVDGSETPAGSFDFAIGSALAVDQANGDFYVYDFGHKVIDQFAVEGEECPYVGQLPTEPPKLRGFAPFDDLAVDDPLEAGEAGYDSPNEGYVYVTSGTKASNSHLFAFAPVKTGGPPEVQAQRAVEINETEALLQAELNPNGLDTAYHFEYLTEAAYLANGESFSGPDAPTSVPVPDAEAKKESGIVVVSEPIAGLAPGTAYRLRLVAGNCEAPEADPGNCLTAGEGDPGGEGEDASFSTYATPPSQSCPNEALRTGPSATLPDCRAYELVTPPDTNGRIPTMTMLGAGFGFNGFETPLASADGGSVVFGSNSGSLPGIGGGGWQDTFEALRDESSGWHSHFTGLSGEQAERPLPGGISSDHGYAFWYIGGNNGSLATDGYQYLHVPTGTAPSLNCSPAAEPEARFEWVGCGSLGFDPYAQGLWISRGGGHVVFKTGAPAGNGSTPVKLEPCGPPTGIRAIYDRTAGGRTRCVSVPPAGASLATDAEFEGDNAGYLGSSADGTTTAFEVGQTMYAGLGDEETVEVATGSTAFGGVSRDGSRVFYLKEPSGGATPQGKIYMCEVALGPCAGAGAQEPVQIGSGGESTFVNVSADGSHVYFVSKRALTPGEENEAREEATEGEENLYVWDGSGVRFVAIVSPLDVSGEFSVPAAATVGGLGLWAVPGHPLGSALDPSRTSPDGGAFVFESHADLTGYDSGGHREIYRYDANAEPGERLRCVSCDPTGAAAESDAQLQSDPSGVPELDALPPVNALAQIDNVNSDGRKVFFQSGDRLVARDLDGKVDVYEWEARGVGGCERQAGCISLISGPRSVEDDYLYAMTPDGHDVYFLSADTLNGEDPGGTPSIYDARVEGGFPSPSPPPGECLGEACQPAVVAPDEPTPASSSFQGAGNLEEGQPSSGRCPKGKRKVKAGGKVRCVRRQAKKRHHPKHHRVNAKRRTAR